MTYLDLVNDVLVRMRENEVVSVNDTLYSRLIGKFVNDSKRRVEDSFDWNVLGTTISVTTTPSTYHYLLTGTNGRFKVIDVINDTNNYELKNAPVNWLNRQFLMANTTQGTPSFYGFNGVDSSGNVYADLYPIPNSAEDIRFNLIVPQDALSSDSTVLLVPSEPVILGAYAMAIAERGEDGSVTSGDAYNLYRLSLADAIAIESSRYCENGEWVAV